MYKSLIRISRSMYLSIIVFREKEIYIRSFANETKLLKQTKINQENEKKKKRVVVEKRRREKRIR